MLQSCCRQRHIGGEASRLHLQGPEQRSRSPRQINRQYHGRVSDERGASERNLLLTVPPRIKNPLVGIPKAQLLEDVENFASTYDLTDIRPLLIKGALVAQSPALLDSIEELDDADRTAIRDEVNHRWKLPKALYLTIILNSVAAAIQGWDQTGEARCSPNPFVGLLIGAF